MIERKILIGLITNTDFLKQIQDDWKQEYLESSTAKLISSWCWEYFKKYKKAPMRDIELIYIKKLKKGIDEELADEIENDILPGLSQEYEENAITNLLDETRQYFIERQIILHKEDIESRLLKGKVEEAEEIVEKFKLKKFTEEEGLDLSNPKILEKLDLVFNTSNQSLIEFPGALGEFWNEQLIRGGFVALLAPEKRGKTYWLLEFMMRAVKQNRKVAFFQAGDMTENQFLMRICIYLSQRSNREKYCGEQYIPVLDCVRNQNDTCEKKIRACNFGFTTMADEDIRKEITKETLIEAFNDYPKYRNCYNCVEWLKKPLGAVWLKKVNIGEPLSLLEAKERVNGFFVENNRQVKISTHANGTLSVSKIDTILENWKRKGFEPDIILIDYVDILEAERKMDVRHQENDKWKALRRLSQEKDCLVITVTQADADSYEKDILSLKNFSEDKRKYGHVTAMFGLNQDKKGREKQIGVMRINQLTAREDDFVVSNTIKVLQKLQIGRPFLGSYY